MHQPLSNPPTPGRAGALIEYALIKSLPINSSACTLQECCCFAALPPPPAPCCLPPSTHHTTPHPQELQSALSCPCRVPQSLQSQTATAHTPCRNAALLAALAPCAAAPGKSAGSIKPRSSTLSLPPTLLLPAAAAAPSPPSDSRPPPRLGLCRAAQQDSRAADRVQRGIAQWSSIVTTGSSSVVGEDETTVFFVIAAARSVAKHSQTAVVGHHWCPATSVGGRGVCMCPPRYSWSVNDIPRCHLQTNCSMSDTGTHPVLPLQLRAAAEMDKDGAEAQGAGEGKGGERVPTPTHSLTLLPLSRCSCLMPWRNTPWLTALPPSSAQLEWQVPTPHSLNHSLTHSLNHTPSLTHPAAAVALLLSRPMA